MCIIYVNEEIASHFWRITDPFLVQRSNNTSVRGGLRLCLFFISGSVTRNDQCFSTLTQRSFLCCFLKLLHKSELGDFLNLVTGQIRSVKWLFRKYAWFKQTTWRGIFLIVGTCVRRRITALNDMSLLQTFLLHLHLSVAVGTLDWAFRSGLPNLFSVAGHFHVRKFIAGHKRFCDLTIRYCDVTKPLILIRFMR